MIDIGEVAFNSIDRLIIRHPSVCNDLFIGYRTDWSVSGFSGSVLRLERSFCQILKRMSILLTEKCDGTSKGFEPTFRSWDEPPRHSAAEPQPKERGQLCPRVQKGSGATRGPGGPRSGKIFAERDEVGR